MDRYHRVAAFLLTLVVASTALASAEAPNVQLRLSGSIVSVVNGKTAFLPMDRAVKTGEIVRYTIVAHNAGAAAAYQLAPLGNIPQRTEFLKVDESPKGARVDFTADGKHWAGHPMSAMRALRWSMSSPLPKGATTTFSYEVRVK